MACGEASAALASRAALQRAMLATAFAAECRPGSDVVPLRALERILRRAQVPGAGSLPTPGDELGRPGEEPSASCEPCLFTPNAVNRPPGDEVNDVVE